MSLITLADEFNSHFFFGFVSDSVFKMIFFEISLDCHNFHRYIDHHLYTQMYRLTLR